MTQPSAVGAPTTQVPIYWVDAFTDRRFGGNPAAVCLLDGSADARWMQGLAAELGLSETAFVWPDGVELSLRWFTPTSEVDLCGHATLASAQALREAGRASDGDLLVFHTRSGRLTARFDGDLVELDLPADPPDPVDLPTVLAEWPATAAAAGESDLVVELESVAAVRAAAPDLAAIASLPYRAVVVTAAGDGSDADHVPDADYVLRVFGPRVGIDEDPVTGSAQCVLGPYWAGRLGRTTLRAVQVSARGGSLRVVVDGDRVRVAGTAVTVLSGRVVGP